MTPKITRPQGPAIRGSRRSSSSRSGLTVRACRSRRDSLRPRRSAVSSQQVQQQRDAGLTGSVRCSRSTGRSCSASTAASPAACAAIKVPNVNGRSGIVDVVRLAGRDLQEHALRRSALVVLAGRVQEARPPAERRGSLGTAGEGGPDVRAARRPARSRGRPSRRGSRRSPSRVSSASIALGDGVDAVEQPGGAAHLDAVLGDLSGLVAPAARRAARGPPSSRSRHRAGRTG